MTKRKREKSQRPPTDDLSALLAEIRQAEDDTELCKALDMLAEDHFRLKKAFVRLAYFVYKLDERMNARLRSLN